MFGDKVKARTTAINADLRVIPGTDGPIDNQSDAIAFANEAGYPLMIKATSGGGGKGMRIVRSEDELEAHFTEQNLKQRNLLVIVRFILKNI